MIFFSYLLLVLALICLDQWLKIWVSTNIALSHSQHFIPGVMDLTNLHNYGAAWSMFQGQQLFFSIVTVVVIAGIGYCFWRFRHCHPILLCLSLILAGAIGNFIDRLLQGYVVDMFEFLPVNFPVFNIADMCLTLGVIMLIIIVLREDDEK
ncbi:signal peptidase II [uncultured Limosilactobacillus sp.]|uniref:signal peptidase II n=1 Tax=uncultured Limosilactobacillus sp. TaxID=2837629 RepID=UPI002585FD17|nr:signal peptidase II [uncultured Limosilactobacillus sp.]